MTDIQTDDGWMDAFVVHPDGNGPFPGVVVLMDIWGLREELFEIARKIAVVGYHVTVPNFWYRRGRIRYEFRDEHGRMRSLVTLATAVQDEMQANMSHLTDGMAMADIGAVLKFLRGEPVRKAPKGVMGYCLGGRLALAAAARFPDQFRASASMHGTRLVNDRPDSPHLSLSRMRGEVYCGFAEYDDLAPPETIATLAQLFDLQPGVRYRAIVHPDTHHGYALPDRDVFDRQAANRDWENIFAMFRRQLG